MRASETERIERRAFLSATTLILAACAWFVLRPILAPVVLAMLTATIRIYAKDFASVSLEKPQKVE